MKTRTVKNILYAASYNMGGFPIRQPIPAPGVESIDPFLLLHHADVKVPTHQPVMQSGVGPHPHRGFSPVTFIFKGGVHHRDSRGNDNVIYEGGVQWMNAGMGIIHSERPPADIFEKGGRQEIIQLWVNTPAAFKMEQPSYQPFSASAIPTIISEDGLATIHISSGELNGVKGPVSSYSEVNTFTAEFIKGAAFSFTIPDTHNAFVYLLDGSIHLPGHGTVTGKNAAYFNNDGDTITIEALEDTRLFIGTGQPLNEAVASHGPFVMSNETQLLEAFRDYQMGKMGVLIEA
ncbi:pirin family protein [Limnovirga soli]|uniref:Pirin family protein n=1 Tax=Limnovirga soli TaxID=2656915 RepID=A0A8J8FEB3_9BACT|nr:pirin family protein [Limnovirga soli]NNV55917.1 pirin family protein [Limnovirga soli]